MTTNFLIGYPHIPYQGEVTTLDDSDTLNSNTDLVSGPKAKVTQLVTATTGKTEILIDAGADTTGEYIGITRAKLLKGSGVTSVAVKASSKPFDYPSTLASLKLWMDGSSKVTADSSSYVSQWDSRAGSISFTNGSAGFQPLWSRADDYENLITYSEQFNQGGSWNIASSPVTITANDTTDPLGTTTADKLTASGGSADHGVYQIPNFVVGAGLTYTMSAYIKAGNFNYAWFGDVNDSVFHGVDVDLSNGTIRTSTNVTSSSITSIGSGWYRVILTLTKSSSTNVGFWLGFSRSSAQATPPTFTPAGTPETIYAWGAQVTVSGNALSTYLQTTTAVQFCGDNGSRAVVFDGVNDSLTSSTDADQIFSATAKTIYIVAQSHTVSGGQGGIIDNVNGVVACGFDTSHKSYMRNYDGTSDYVLSASALSRKQMYLLEFRHESGTIYHNVDGGSDQSTASGSTTAMTADLVLGRDLLLSSYFRGKVFEIVVFNAALSGTERTNMRTYLTAKYQTAALLEWSNVQTTTLTGPGADDYISEFTPTSARYWNVSFDSGTTSSKRPFSQLYLGSFFDLGRDPVWGRVVNLKDVGDRGGRIPYTFEFFWEGITNENRASFETTIGKYTGEVFYLLYADSYDYVLNGHEPLYVRIASYNFTPASWLDNSLTISFEEVT